MSPYGLRWPGRWETSSLAQVTTKVTSGSRDWKPYYGRGPGVFILTQNIRMGTLDLASPCLVDPPEGDPARDRSEVMRGDVLLTIVGANVGNVARVPQTLKEHYVCQSVALIRPGMQLRSRFLEFFLMAPHFGQRYFGQCTYGQGRPHLSFADIKAMPVPVPSLGEQDRIVTEVERLIGQSRQTADSLRTALHDIEVFEASVLNEAFDPRDASGDLPVGWDEKLLPEIAKVEYGKALPAKKRTAGRVAVVGSAGVSGTHDESLVEDGPVVVIGRKGAAGRVTLTEAPVWVIDTAYFVRVPREYNASFLALQLRSARLERLDQSTAIPSLSRDDLHRHTVRLPSRAEQDRVVAKVEERLGRARDAAGRIRSALANIERFEAAVLRDAFSGRLMAPGERVSELADVDAEQGNRAEPAESGSVVA